MDENIWPYQIKRNSRWRSASKIRSWRSAWKARRAAQKLLPRRQQRPETVILLYRLLVLVNAEVAPVLDERVRRLNVSIPGDKRSRPRCILKPVPPCVKQIIGSVSGNLITSEYWENYPDHQETTVSQKFPKE